MGLGTYYLRLHRSVEDQLLQTDCQTYLLLCSSDFHISINLETLHESTVLFKLTWRMCSSVYDGFCIKSVRRIGARRPPKQLRQAMALILAMFFRDALRPSLRRQMALRCSVRHARSLFAGQRACAPDNNKQTTCSCSYGSIDETFSLVDSQCYMASHWSLKS